MTSNFLTFFICAKEKLVSRQIFALIHSYCKQIEEKEDEIDQYDKIMDAFNVLKYPCGDCKILSDAQLGINPLTDLKLYFFLENEPKYLNQEQMIWWKVMRSAYNPNNPNMIVNMWFIKYH
jgi:hypothetical protein